MGALVTGGAGGIGSACALRLAQDGAAVTIMGRTESSLEAAVAEMRPQLPAGAVVQHVVGDARVDADIQKAVEVAAAPTGRFTICVGVVGGSGMPTPLLMMDEEMLTEDLRRNIVTPFLAIKACTPKMVEAGGGSIVCISSVTAGRSTPFLAGYSAAKAGMEMLLRVAADELGRVNVRINCVRPGLVRTKSAGVKRVFDDHERVAEYLTLSPLQRTGEPIDIAEGVRFLAGPESSWVTGQTLAIDGGSLLRGGLSFEPISRRNLGDDAIDRALAGRTGDTH
jgi:NAD(P)-dependent dehydrogenase (short-subunit alcohol dehydrogenase family)